MVYLSVVSHLYPNCFTLCIIVGSDTANSVIAAETKKTDINSVSRERGLNDLPDTLYCPCRYSNFNLIFHLFVLFITLLLFGESLSLLFYCHQVYI